MESINQQQLTKSHHKSEKSVVTSTYAELYLEDDYCGFQKDVDDKQPVCTSSHDYVRRGSWTSPSDCIIGLVDSIPPYTTRVLRSKTHFGILAYGENLINEYDTFHKDLDKLIKENDAVCRGILEHQMKSIMKKVKQENAVILAKKTNIFMSETSKFYEESLQELEDHLRSELQTVLIDLQATFNREFNSKISDKLKTEKQKLDTILKEKLMYEVRKMKYYYQLLLANVVHFNNKLKNQAIIESNDTLRAFLRQMNAENITNTMYILCEERKKCKIRQFIVQSHQTSEITDIKSKLKIKLDVLDDLEKNNTGVFSMKSWEEKLTKIMQLFLKFIGFSLKLLPEQVTFLLDLEKMVVLQLNELQKSSLTAPPILVDKNNIFNFEKTKPIKPQCNKKPFEIIGDISEDVPTQYSRETIPSNVDLPYIRVGREYIYARCENFEEVKTLLESQQCTCRSDHEIEQVRIETDISLEKLQEQEKQANITHNDLPIEHLLIDDIHKLKECPVRKCNFEKPKLRNIFSNLDSFLNFTEDNFEKLKSFTTEIRTLTKVQKINPADIVFDEVPFAETKDRYCSTETQYSSQETFREETTTCPCVNGIASPYASSADTKTEQTRSVNSIMHERKMMLSKLVHDHPRLLNIVLDEESYNLPF